MTVRIGRLTWVGIMVVAAVSWPEEALAVRYGLFVAQRHGLSHEKELLYTEQDAGRLRSILRRYGGFRPENTVFVADSNASTVQHALLELNEKIRNAGPDPDSMLFVYYSGHAGRQALHLSGSKLRISRLKKLVRNSPARLRLLVLDACRSGIATRIKGAQHVPPFDIGLTGSLNTDGLAIMTSSSFNEVSQEADAIRGSIFTHFLGSGLLGPADTTGDFRVSLEEAYVYAYKATIAATSRAMAVQHPTFQYDIRGHGSVALTDLTNGNAATGQLVVPAQTNVIVLRQDGEDVAAEVAKHAANRHVVLPAGPYLVRIQRPDHYLEGIAAIHADQTTRVAWSDLESFRYGRLVRKGDVHDERSQAVLATAGGRRGPLRSFGAGTSLGLTYLIETPQASFGARATFAVVKTENPRVESSLRAVEANAIIRHVWDIAMFSLWVGVGAGVWGAEQSYKPQMHASNRMGIGPMLTAESGLMMHLGQGYVFGLEAQVAVYCLRMRPENNLSVRPGVVAAFVVGKQF